MVSTPEEVITQIGEEYMDLPVRPEEAIEASFVAQAFGCIAEINEQLFEDIPVEVIFQEDDPYDDYSEMEADVLENDTLRIFSGGDPHPYWDWDTELKGRAVHDWHGHLKHETGFDVVGEYVNWKNNRLHYPVWCERVLFTEVIGQLGAAYYLEDGFADDRFEQKVFASPARWIEQLDHAIENVTDT